MISKVLLLSRQMEQFAILRLKTKLKGIDCFLNLAPQCKSAVVSQLAHRKPEYLVSGGALTCILVAIETDLQVALSHLDSLSDFNYFSPEEVLRARIFYNSDNKDSFELAEKFQRYVKSLPNNAIQVDLVALSRNEIGSVVYLDENFGLSVLNKAIEKVPRENMIIYSYAASLLKPLYIFNFSVWRENLFPSLIDEVSSHADWIRMCFWVVANRAQEIAQFSNAKLQLVEDDQKVELIITNEIVTAIIKYLQYHKQNLTACKRYKIDYFRPKRSFKTFELSALERVDTRSIDVSLLDLYRYDPTYSVRHNIFAKEQ